MVARHLSIRHIHIQNHHFLQFLTYKFISFVTNHLLVIMFAPIESCMLFFYC